jgi:L-ascorbate metabolism protein UlaG (beta-lactamase superfamily)
MKIKTYFFAVSITFLFVFSGFVRAEEWNAWPVKLKDLEEPTIHAGAMAKIAEFGKKFRSVPVGNDANNLAEKDSNSTNKYAWLGDTLEFVSKVLKTYPPEEKNKSIRKAALLILDYPLHVDNKRSDIDQQLLKEWQEAVGKYYQEEMEQGLKEIKTVDANSGLIIWKMYNMGFVVKSKNHTIGFDIVPGAQKPLNTEQMTELADKLDILFISHIHSDHMNEKFIDSMIRAGKKVVLPTSVTAKVLSALQLDDKNKNIIRLYDNYKEPLSIDGVTVRCFPGQQDSDTPCNIYAVTVDNYTVLHNGDNTRTEIYSEIPKYDKVDVLLVNCWSGMAPCISATNPKLVITGHENEVKHKVAKRLSYLQTFHSLSGCKNLPKNFVLDWGECISYPDCRSLRTGGQKLPLKTADSIAGK